MCQPIDVLIRMIDMFNDYNVPPCLKAMCTLDDIETNIGCFGHDKEDFQKLKFKISSSHLDLMTSNKIIRFQIMYQNWYTHWMSCKIKALELKHMKKNLERNGHEVESSSHPAKGNKKGNLLLRKVFFFLN